MDVLDVVAHGEHGLPARHRIRAHDGMDSLEHIADILGSTAGGGEELEIVFLGCCVEVWLGVVGCERVEKAPECGRDAIVQFVSRGPEGV